MITTPSSGPFLAQYLGDHLSLEHCELLQGFLISFTIWNLLNLVAMNIKLPDKDMPREDMLDLRNRIISIIHGTGSMVLAGYNTYFVHSQCGEPNSNFENFLMNFSLGYFAYDLAAMAYLGILDKSMFIHHNICITALIFGLFTGYSADILVSTVFLTEISNPPMHVRVVLRHLGLRYTKAYEIAELSYMVLYMFGRLVLGTPVLIRTWVCDANHIMVKFMGTGLFAQSFYFITKMVSILKSRSREYAERKRKNIKMKWFTSLTKEEIG